jgi:hypothetical protein
MGMDPNLLIGVLSLVGLVVSILIALFAWLKPRTPK